MSQPISDKIIYIPLPLPDLYSWITLVNPETNQVIPYEPATIFVQQGQPVTVLVNWSIGNKGDKDSPLFAYAYSLYKTQNNVTTRIVPPGNSPFLHLPHTSVQKNSAVTKHFQLFDVVYQMATFKAMLHADVGNTVTEVDETNNIASRTFVVRWST